jgi:hypothetical protein
MSSNATRCRRCRGEILEARTESGYDVTLDPAALTPLGELRAQVAGRTTYTRHTYSGAVHYRHPSTIRARPAGSRPRQDVHATHACTPDPGKVDR